jgi:hypothetical protein
MTPTAPLRGPVDRIDPLVDTGRSPTRSLDRRTHAARGHIRARRDAVTDRPDAEHDTAAWDDFDPPDSTLDWITNASPPSGPAPQRAPNRDDDEAGQPFARQPQWESDPSWTLFSDRSSPSRATPPSGPPPRDLAPGRPAIAQFVRVWAIELADRRIRVNTYSAWPTETPGLAGLAVNPAESERLLAEEAPAFR